MLHLKDDMDVSSLTFLGTIAHILGPIYLSECFPKVTVLNLGIKSRSKVAKDYIRFASPYSAANAAH